jgi:hypothetical protein
MGNSLADIHAGVGKMLPEFPRIISSDTFRFFLPLLFKL